MTTRISTESGPAETSRFISLPRRLMPNAGAGRLSLAHTAHFLAWLFLMMLPDRVQAQLDFVTNNGSITITGYYGTNAIVSVPETTNGYPVACIASGAFICGAMNALIIPDTVTNIEPMALYDCNAITNISIDAKNPAYCSVEGIVFSKDQTVLVRYPGGLAGGYTIPDCVTTIGNSAFATDRMLSSITIPNSVTNIGASAFFYDSFGSINVPDSVTSIGVATFSDCFVLTKVTIGTNVSIIPTNAFSACDDLVSITIPDGVTSIEPGAFSGCADLANVTLGNSVTNIGEAAFNGCAQLTNFVFGTNVISIGYSAFSDCSGLSALVIPNSVITIGQSAFGYCGGLNNVIIGSGVESIGSQTFYQCTSLTNVIIGDGVTDIGGFAFCSCFALTSVTLGASLTNIESYAFDNCGSLDALYFKGDAPGADSSAFVGDPDATAYYLAGTTGWAAFAVNTGVPAVLWNPQIQTSGSSFGIRTNEFGFNITGTPDIPLVVEASINAANPVWSALQALTLTNGLVYFSDPQWTNYPSRIYRISAP
jgi:hypothetical protein